MKKIFCLILLFCPIVMIFSQNQVKIDSLLTELPKLKENPAKADILNNLSWEYYSKGNRDTAFFYAQKALKLSQKLNFKKGKATALRYIGNHYADIGETDKSLDNYQKALGISKDIGDKKGVVYNLRNIGLRYAEISDFPKSMENYQQALKTAKEINDQTLIITVYNDIGWFAKKISNYPLALENYLQALKISEKSGDKRNTAGILGEIGWLYRGLEDGDRALDFMNRALEIYVQLEDKKGTSEMLSIMGNVYMGIEEYQKSLEYYNGSSKIKKEINDELGLSSNYANVAYLYQLQSEYATAIEYHNKSFFISNKFQNKYGELVYYKDMGNLILNAPDSILLSIDIPPAQRYQTAIDYEKRAFKLAEEVNDPMQKGASSYFLTLAYEKSGDFKSAYYNFQYNIALRDSVQGQSVKEEIVRKEVQYDYEKKADAAKAEQEKKDIRQRTIRNSLIAGLSAFFLFSVIIYRQRNKTKKAKRRAEHSEKVKQQFLANMSHEIRTPMNAIMGMTNLVLETPLNEKQKNYLAGVKKSSENLLHIINDILDFSKIEAGKMELEEINFSIHDITEQMVTMLRHKADEKGIEIFASVSADVPDALVGDPVRLNQVLMNLAGNAIKFTEKGFVQIDVAKISEEEEGVRIRFSVIDTGIGIPPDKVNKIFESFSQANSSDTRKYGGTGLGLSISRQFIELMGGKLELKSVPGSGSTFFFELNLPEGSKDKLAEESSKQIDSSILNGLKILLADDNADNRIVARDTIESKAKVTIIEAVNGHDVLEKLSEQDFDIILMDVQMPVIDGLEATKKIRSEFTEPKKNIPIIALTASVIRTDLDKCRVAGMNDYVPKPFAVEELIKTIAKLTGRELKFRQAEKPKQITEVSKSQNTDLTYLKEFCEGDEMKMKKYINIFLESVPGFIQKLETAATGNNFEEIATQVHSFKTKFVMMGMEEAKQLSVKLEADCHAVKPDQDRIIQNTTEIIRMILEAADELRNENIVKFTT